MSNRAEQRFHKKNYDSYLLLMPKGAKEKLAEAVRARGYKSLNAYLLSLAERDTGIDLVLRGELAALKKKSDSAETK